MRKSVISIIILSLIVIPVLVLQACAADDENVMIIKTDDGPWLGVQIEEISEKMRKDLDIDNGVSVSKVIKDSPAEKAGLKKGDVIISYDGKEITNIDELVKYVKKSEIDEKVALKYFRDGEIDEVEVTLAENKNVFRWFGDNKSGHRQFEFEKHAWLGVKTENLNDQLREYFGAPEELGVLIKEVLKESPAEETGLKAGDVIIEVADRKIKNTRDLVRSINYYDPDEVVDVKVIRNKDDKTFKVKLGKSEGPSHFRFYGSGDNLIEIPDFDVDVPHIEVHPEIDIEIDMEELEDMEKKIEKGVKIKKLNVYKKFNEV